MRFEVEMDDTEMRKMIACGTTEDLSTVITMLAHEVYMQMESEQAEMFKFLLQEAFKDNIPFVKDEEQLREIKAKKLSELHDILSERFGRRS